jgi:hypothetical protein
MRHTSAARFARVKPAQVQDFMDHKDFKTTLNYIYLEDEDMADVAMTAEGGLISKCYFEFFAVGVAGIRS